MAYVAGDAVTSADLMPALLARAGGEVLGAVVLRAQLEARLAARGITIDNDAIAAERDRLARQIDGVGRDVAARDRLMQALAERRPDWEAALWHSAALRALVAGDVTVTDDAVRTAYDVRYGPRYRVRLIVVDTAEEAARLRALARRGEPFADLAMQHSTDPSSLRGGMLAAVSPADEGYPLAVRRAVGRFADAEPGAVSGVVAVDTGFAILRLVEAVPADGVDFADVADELRARTRLRLERIRMRQLARALLDEADVVVLDRTLGESWARWRDAAVTDGR